MKQHYRDRVCIPRTRGLSGLCYQNSTAFFLWKPRLPNIRPSFLLNTTAIREPDLNGTCITLILFRRCKGLHHRKAGTFATLKHWEMIHLLKERLGRTISHMLSHYRKRMDWHKIRVLYSKGRKRQKWFWSRQGWSYIPDRISCLNNGLSKEQPPPCRPFCHHHTAHKQQAPPGTEMLHRLSLVLIKSSSQNLGIVADTRGFSRNAMANQEGGYLPASGSLKWLLYFFLLQHSPVEVLYSEIMTSE